MRRWISRGAAALLGLPFTIAAQTPGQPAKTAAQPTDEQISEEIVVTAQKRTTTLQDVPFSIAAMTSQDIKESGATNLVEIARNVPGLYITDLGPGQSQVAIRGISAGQVVRDQPGVKESVGIYLDESPISVALFTPDLDLYDLDRIEVLRGPQGTLFGAGSSSGTVRYITAQPNVGRFGGSAEVGFNTLSGGDWGGSLRGALNVPLSEDSAMRAVGY
jgi:iron complex outermembrane receptor protein